MKFSNLRKLIFLSIIIFSSVNNQLFDFIQKTENNSQKSELESFFTSANLINDKSSHRIAEKENNNKNTFKKVDHTVNIKNNENLQSNKKDESVFDQIDVKAHHNNQQNLIQDKIEEQIQNNKKEITELEKIEQKNARNKNNQVKEIKLKFKKLTEKTREIKKLFNKQNSLGELIENKQKIENNQNISDKYIDKLSKIKVNISLLFKEAEQLSEELSKHENENHIEEIISSIEIDKTEIENNLIVKGLLKAKNTLSKEMRIGRSNRINDDVIEVDNSYLIEVMGKKYDMNSLLYYNEMMNKLRENCGNNLTCLVSKEEVTSMREKEELMKHTINNIRRHLELMKN